MLAVSSAGSLGSGPLTINVGILDATMSFALSQNISLGTSAAMIEVNSGMFTVTSVVSGAGAFQTYPAAAHWSSPDEQLLGGQTISGGSTLQLGNGSSGGSVSGNINDQGTLTFSARQRWALLK